MEDVLEVYHRPYDARRPVVCVDECSKELHDTPRGSLPLQAGEVAREDYEYERRGVCNLFLAMEPLRGWRSVRVTERRTKLDFLSVLDRQCLDRRIADAETLAQEANAWQDRRNHAVVTVDWQFTAEDARIKLKRLYPVIKEQNSS